MPFSRISALHILTTFRRPCTHTSHTHHTSIRVLCWQPRCVQIQSTWTTPALCPVTSPWSTTPWSTTRATPASASQTAPSSTRAGATRAPPGSHPGTSFPYVRVSGHWPDIGPLCKLGIGELSLLISQMRHIKVTGLSLCNTTWGNTGGKRK